ncbi:MULTISPECIES: DUF4176 domain-containing protein [unclassified Clostridium]|uniref:DUF4176 domain-containing protein n=1 Tax=unclassified Clostridium TaxID=2614128 RepID=UPI002079C50C
MKTLLPIGSIVLLKDSNKKLMINGKGEFIEVVEIVNGARVEVVRSNGKSY